MSIFINFLYHIKERAKALFKNAFNAFRKLFSYLSRIEKYFVFLLLGIVFISLILLIGEQFFIKKIKTPSYGGTYTEGELGDIRFLMPILNQNEVEKDIDKLIFSSLIKFNQKDEIIPDLAQNWEILDSGKTYKFYLKDAKWQDGKQIQSDDVIYTYNLIKNEEIKSPYFEILKDVDIGKIDDKTFSLSLKVPKSYFLSSLNMPILPKHLLENIKPIDLSTATFSKNPIGSGPFKIEKIKKNGKLIQITLLRNGEYFLQKPYLSKFIIKIYQDEEELEDAFLAHRIDGYLGEEAKDKTNKIKLHRFSVLFFNLKHLKTKELRKAISFSINKDEILNETTAEKIYYPILPGDLGYKEGEKIEYNLETAKQLFASVKNPPTSLKLLTKEGEENLRVSEIIKKQIEAIGITVEIESAENSHFDQIAQERNYDMLLIGLDQKEDPDPYPFWHSSFTQKGFNFSGLQNREVDKLLEDGLKITDLNTRQQKYEKFIDIIQSEIPAVFLYQRFYYYNHRSIIKGIEDTFVPAKSDRFWNVESWYIKTKKIKS